MFLKMREKLNKLLLNAQLQREQSVRTQRHITLDEIGRRIALGDFKELTIILKVMWMVLLKLNRFFPETIYRRNSSQYHS